jgi:hypothetical protein
MKKVTKKGIVREEVRGSLVLVLAEVIGRARLWRDGVSNSTFIELEAESFELKVEMEVTVESVRACGHSARGAARGRRGARDGSPSSALRVTAGQIVMGCSRHCVSPVEVAR